MKKHTTPAVICTYSIVVLWGTILALIINEVINEVIK